MFGERRGHHQAPRERPRMPPAKKRIDWLTDSWAETVIRGRRGVTAMLTLQLEPRTSQHG